MNELKDGISKTLILTESREESYSSWYDGMCTWIVILHYPQTFVAEQSDGFLGPADTPFARLTLNIGRRLYLREGEYYLALQEPFQFVRVCGPSSQHSGEVVIHAFADARVVPITEAIDPNVYYRLCTVAGGEPVEPPR